MRKDSMFKKILRVGLPSLVVTAMVIPTVVLAAEGGNITNISYDENEIRQLEKKHGIETKSAEELFLISNMENQEGVNIQLLENQKEIEFASIPEIQTAKRTKQVEYFLLNDGFRVSAIIDNTEDILSAGLQVSGTDTWTIEYAKYPGSDEGNGSLGIYNEAGEAVASTGLPTVIDATGKEISSNFIIENNDIKVKLEETEAVTYPITVEYGVYGASSARSVTAYFQYAGFDRVYTGSLTLGPRYFDEGSVVSCTQAWDSVYNAFFPYGSYWTTSTQTESMEDQYWCHADFAKNKDNWNLEPDRPVVSWPVMIIKQCNP